MQRCQIILPLSSLCLSIRRDRLWGTNDVKNVKICFCHWQGKTGRITEKIQIFQMNAALFSLNLPLVDENYIHTNYTPVNALLESSDNILNTDVAKYRLVGKAVRQKVTKQDGGLMISENPLEVGDRWQV